MNLLERLARYWRTSERTPNRKQLERDRPPVPIRRPRGRPSYDQGVGSFLNPWGRVSPTQNFGLYAAIREGIPLIDAAIDKKRQLVGCPMIDAAPETKAEIEAWLGSLNVNHLQKGWNNWLGTWIDNALLYGRAHTEILLNNTGTEVWGLQELHPKTIFLRPHPDRYSVQVVQSQPLNGEPVLLPPLLMLNYIHKVRGDDPNGTALLWGLPFVAEIMQKLLKNLGSTWDRYGTPRYHINWEPPEDWDDPTGEQADEIMSGIAAQFTQSLESGMQGDILDFYTSGKVRVDIIGAQGESLAIEMPMRAIAEQIIAKTDLPPFAFGFSWAEGQQLSQMQADLLITAIKAQREEITPEIHYLIDFRQRLIGGDREFKILWPEPTLIDVFAKTRADFFRQNALQLQLTNLFDLWRIGGCDQYYLVRQVRPEFAHLSDTQIDARLPDLAKAPPEDAPPAATGPGRTGTGGGGGLGPGSDVGRTARDVMDGLWEEAAPVYRAVRNGKR